MVCAVPPFAFTPQEITKNFQQWMEQSQAMFASQWQASQESWNQLLAMQENFTRELTNMQSLFYSFPAPTATSKKK